MRRACIDIGSNTTRLLVADCEATQLTVCHEQRAYTRIGAVARAGVAIPAAKLEEVAAVVVAQVEVARGLGATDLHCLATAAVRRATNGGELAALIAERTDGLVMRVVTGEEEARLAFVGALRTAVDNTLVAQAGSASIAVADVGGGSSEVVVGTATNGVAWWQSLQLGSSDLTDMYFRAQRPEPAEIEQAREHIRFALEELKPPRIKAAVAVGGSGTSLRRLAGAVLDEGSLRSALHLLAGTDPEEIASRSGLEMERIRLLPAGLLILEGISALLKTPLVVASGGVREGVLLDAEARGPR